MEPPLLCVPLESRVILSRRNRLIQEVVIMVLRGAQSLRFGPAGCAFLTRRALSSHQTRFRQEQFRCHPSATRRSDDERAWEWTPQKRFVLAISQRTRIAWCEQVMYVMGILGNRHRAHSHGDHGDCVYPLAVFGWRQGGTEIEVKCRQIG